MINTYYSVLLERFVLLLKSYVYTSMHAFTMFVYNIIRAPIMVACELYVCAISKLYYIFYV